MELQMSKHFPPRDTTKYPNPQDEPLDVQCLRMGVRMPNPGESMLEWGQSDPFRKMREPEASSNEGSKARPTK